MLLLLLASAFTACNITKQLRSSQQLLYKGHTLKVEGEKRRDVVNPIEDYIKQKPNKKFIGIVKLRMRFYMGISTEKQTGFLAKIKNNYGEPPVILDTAFIESTVKSIKGYMRSKGFYYPEVTYTVKAKRNRRAVVNYHVKTNHVYHISTYQINCADKEIYDLVKGNLEESLVQPGNRLVLDVLSNEEKRIVDLMRDFGYYTFTNEFISFDVDTSGNSWNAKVALNIMNKSMYETHQKHYVRNVYVNIEPNYDISAFKNQDTLVLPEFYYISNKYKLNPFVLKRNIFLTPGKLFQQKQLNRTYNRLGDLGVFRFINITPKNYELNDSAFVDYQVRLAPTIKYDYVIEPQAIVSDQNNTFTNQTANYGNYGIAGIFQFNNRNMLKGAEVFKLTLRSSFEAQGRVSGNRWFNATEQSLTASITTPRLVFLNKTDRKINAISTRTIFTTSGIYELNSDFERRVLTTGMIWQVNKKNTSFYLTPAEVSFTRNNITSDTLLNNIDKDIYLFNMFTNNLIIGSRFGFTYTNKGTRKGIHYIVLRWDVLESSGNVITLFNNLVGAPKNENGTYEILGVNYSQFLKSALDFRFNTVYDENNATVYRLFAGVGLPYGNSPGYLPFERRFWVGGANSLRAWLPRSLGPGSYYESGQIDYSGDIKIELNAEFRFNMYNRWLEGAVFTDAGNVWMSKKDENRPNAHFAFDRFWREFGWGAGIGTRLNLEVILIRFDFAIPLHDPSYNERSRWVIQNFERDWLYRNLNFNFGIGYPF